MLTGFVQIATLDDIPPNKLTLRLVQTEGRVEEVSSSASATRSSPSTTGARTPRPTSTTASSTWTPTKSSVRFTKEGSISGRAKSQALRPMRR